MKNLTKQTMSKLFVLSTCVALIVSATTYASDVETTEVKSKDKHSHHMKKKHKIKGEMKGLKLTDAQKIEIKAIKSNAKNENEALRLQMTEFKQKEKTLLQAEVFDESSYIALFDEYQSVRSQLALNKAKNRHAIKQLLSEEQLKKMKRLKKHKMKKLTK